MLFLQLTWDGPPLPFECPVGTCLDVKQRDCDFSITHCVPYHTYTGRQRLSVELQMELVQLEELCREQEGNICNRTRVQVAGGQSTSRRRFAQLLSCAKSDWYAAVAAWIGSECLRQILGLLVLVFISCKMGSTAFPSAWLWWKG